MSEEKEKETTTNSDTQKFFESQIKSAELQSTLISILARASAVEIITNIINAIIASKKSIGEAVSEEVIKAIQDAVNIEGNKTSSLIDSLSKSIRG